MYIELGNIFDVENIDDMIDNSFNGTCFSYSWFLKLKDSFKILKIYNSVLYYLHSFDIMNKTKAFRILLYNFGGNTNDE